MAYLFGWCMTVDVIYDRSLVEVQRTIEMQRLRRQ